MKSHVENENISDSVARLFLPAEMRRFFMYLKASPVPYTPRPLWWLETPTQF